VADTKKPSKTTKVDERSQALSDEELAALKETVRERKAEARRGSRADKAAEEEAEVLAKIAEMPKPDRVMAERIHAIVKASAPDLAPKTWYGMPAYAKDGKVVCFFTAADKFKERYATFGFNAAANLDDGNMWPTAFALTKLTAADDARIATLVKRAVAGHVSQKSR
jgi:uncharacterized protein YdhG (YjbR/CyaY superfamily)